MRRRLLAFFPALVLLACLASVPASAARITMSGAGSGYAAYRIMDLSQGVKPGHSNDGTCPVDGCDKVTNPNGHYAYTYSVNAVYLDIVKSVLGLPDTASDSECVAAVGALEPDGVREFADGVYKAILADSGMTPDATSSGKTFEDVPDGYYLIAETGNAGNNDSTSLVMLDTAGLDDITVESKEDVPVLTKKIIDDDGTRLDAEIVSVGDVVDYEIIITRPAASVMDSYPRYTYVVHDSLQTEKVLALVDGSVECFTRDGDSGVEIPVTPDRISVRRLGQEVSCNACDLEVAFDDVKPLFEGKSDDAVLIIRYSCTVQPGALCGNNGNMNTAHIEFSNDPYAEGETGTGPDDMVGVFTFRFEVDKTDEHGDGLSGAEFELSRYEGDYEAGIGKWGDPMPMQVRAGTETPGSGFYIEGIGNGYYRLHEKTAPAGYQACEDVIFVVWGDPKTDDDEPNLDYFDILKPGFDPANRDASSMTKNADATFQAVKGDFSTTVVNVPGSRLPSTGGAGTYLVYGGGAALVILGIVLVLVKKRSGD